MSPPTAATDAPSGSRKGSGQLVTLPFTGSATKDGAVVGRSSAGAAVGPRRTTPGSPVRETPQTAGEGGAPRDARGGIKARGGDGRPAKGGHDVKHNKRTVRMRLLVAGDVRARRRTGNIPGAQGTSETCGRPRRAADPL